MVTGDKASDLGTREGNILNTEGAIQTIANIQGSRTITDPDQS